MVGEGGLGAALNVLGEFVLRVSADGMCADGAGRGMLCTYAVKTLRSAVEALPTAPALKQDLTCLVCTVQIKLVSKAGVRRSLNNLDCSGTASQVTPQGRHQHANASGG